MRCAVIVFALAAAALGAPAAQDWQELVSKAKPGETVTLPAGTASGRLAVPAGVSIKGAGVDKTIIMADDFDNGVEIIGGKGAAVSDLTVRGAKGAGILVRDAQDVTIRRVRATQGMIGVSMAGAKAGRIENVVADGNRYGVVVSGGEGNVVANCTIADNASLGLSLPSGKGTVAFNNVVTGSATAVYVGQQAQGLVLDHNLYGGLNIGRFRSQLPRRTLNDWRCLSGLDWHSVSIPVRYEDPGKGRFAVNEPLDWSPNRTITAAWGAAKLAGHASPAEDIDGVKRPARPGLGAYETAAKAPRPADGTFTVTRGVGLTSAGVFDSKGRLVAYLFQAMPLPKGEHSFWLPPRAHNGKNIEAGDYELRVLEGKLDWQYLGTVGNSGTSDDPKASAPVVMNALAFDAAGRIIVGRDMSEEHVNLRAYDGTTGKWLWLLNGNSILRGLAVASDGLIYAMRLDGGQMRLTRLDPATGKIAPWGKTDYGSFVFKDGAAYTGLTALGERLYYTDTSRNALRVGTIQSPEPTSAIEVNAPSCPAADSKTNVVWVISGGKELVAVSAEGKVVARYGDVPQPVAMAARDGRLAVASSKTGKVHIFDATEPGKLKPLAALGRGDGPDGLVLPDRFMFQDGAMIVNLAFGPKGQLAVGEEDRRLQVFDKDGKLLSSTFFDCGGKPAASTTHRVYGKFTSLLDGEKGVWQVESFHRAMAGGRVTGHFEAGGRTFLVLNSLHKGQPAPQDKRPPYWMSITLVEFTPEKVRPLSGLVWKWASKEPWTWRTDDNHDNIIDENDEVVSTLTGPDGKPVTGQIFDHRFTYLQPNGDLTTGGAPGVGSWVVRWPCAGLDKQGVPIYRFADRAPVAGAKDAVVSPYDRVATGPASVDHVRRADGGWVCLYRCSVSWPVMLNNGGTDVVGVDKSGQVDWVHPFGQYNVIGSLTGGGGLYVAALADTYDCFVLNDDGLELNGVSPAEKANFVGHWVDDPSMVATLVDPQGKVNVLMGDYVSKPGAHWYRLQKRDVRADKVPFKVTAETAAQLAALPAKPFDVTAGKPAKPIVRIPRLKVPLKIDGDMKKWRDLGIAPQVIITPDTSTGIEGGAGDCSAIVRLAYHGQDLYLQVLRFDDVITTHQPRSRAYQQDTVELAVNGIWEGIKFNLSLTADVGPVNQVDGRGLRAHTLERDHSPLVIKVLDNAEEATERQVIESIYGVDLRGCKVQLFETRVPMDEKTYAGRLDARFDLKSGAEFYMGFLIDDNDQPGTDLQNFLWWPVTYGNFNPVDSGARAVLE